MGRSVADISSRLFYFYSLDIYKESESWFLILFFVDKLVKK